MRAWVLRGGFGLDRLTMESRPTPSVGPRDVLVRVHAVSLNYRDLAVVEGFYNPKLTNPLVIGSDAAGEVVDIGVSVTRFRPGDRVMPIFSQRWIAGEPDFDMMTASQLGAGNDGVLADQVVLDESGLVQVPSHLSFAEAACLPCAGVTAWQSIVTLGSTRPGDTVLVQGTGGVSLFALQFALMAGARVIATSSSDEKLARVKALGAHEVINYRTSPDWSDRVLDLTGGRGADLIVEVGGAETFAETLKALRLGGSVMLVGFLAGWQCQIDLRAVLRRRATIHGVSVGSREMFEAMCRGLTASKVYPVIDRCLPATEAVGALKRMKEGKHFGKIVLELS